MIFAKFSSFGKKFSSNGPFWSSIFNNEILENYINKILSYDELTWKKKIEENIGDLVKYDPGNASLKKILNNLQIKNILN